MRACAWMRNCWRMRRPLKLNVRRLQKAALEILASGRNVILYSARGPRDPMMVASNDSLRERGFDELTIRERLGKTQGILLRELLLEQWFTSRLCRRWRYIQPRRSVSLEFMLWSCGRRWLRVHRCVALTRKIQNLTVWKLR